MQLQSMCNKRCKFGSNNIKCLPFWDCGTITCGNTQLFVVENDTDDEL